MATKKILVLGSGEVQQIQSADDIEVPKLNISIPAVDLTVTGFSIDDLQAAGTISQMDLVYLNSSGKWAQASAFDESTSKGMLGISLESKTVNQTMSVALAGSIVRNDTWNWTVGATLFVSSTTAQMTETAPSTNNSVVRIVGYAINADTVYFLPMGSYVVHA